MYQVEGFNYYTYLFILFEGIGKSIPFNSVLYFAISNHFTASEKVAPSRCIPLQYS